MPSENQYSFNRSQVREHSIFNCTRFQACIVKFCLNEFLLYNSIVSERLTDPRGKKHNCKKRPKHKVFTILIYLKLNSEI